WVLLCRRDCLGRRHRLEDWKARQTPSSRVGRSSEWLPSVTWRIAGFPVSACSAANVRPPRSEQLAGFVEVQPRAARKQLGRIAVAEVAQKVGLDVAVGEILLLEVVLRGRPEGKELVIDLGVVEARHRPAVEPQAARR